VTYDLRNYSTVIWAKQTLITRYDVDPEAVAQSFDGWLKGF